MRKRIRLYFLIGSILVLAAAVLTAVVSCSNNPTGKNSEPAAISGAAQLYSDAVSGLPTDSISYRVTTTKETVIGSEVFTQSATQTVTFEALGTADLRGMVQETLSIGSHTVQIRELFNGETGYFTVEDSHFCSQMSAETYIARYAPAVLMDPSLYGSISGFKAEDCYTVEFANATALESWLWDQDAQFVSADGTAVITEDGQLLKSTYNASYQLGKTYIRLSVTTEPQAAEPVVLPQDLTQYQNIAYIDAPRMLEIACGHLLESVSVTAHYTDSIHCQAFGDQRTQSIDIYAVNAADWSSRIDTQVTLTNSSKAGTDSVIGKTELFTDGKYTIRINDSEPSENTDIDAQAMRSLCQDILVGTIMLPQHINGAEMEETEDTLVIRFTASEEFAQLIRADACTALYRDPELLNNQTQDYATQTAVCYLTFDRATGLPLSSGFSYVGIYTMDALPYPLEFSADQQYDLVNDEANKAIKEAGA